MHFYRILICICFILFNEAGFSQFQIGVKQGAFLNNISKYYDTENYKAIPSIGYCSGVIIKYTSKNKLFGIVTGLNLIQKNYRLDNLNYVEIYQKNLNTFLDLPLKIQGNFKYKRLVGYINSGIVISRWMQSRVRQNLPDIYDTNYNSDGSENIPLREITTDYHFDKRKDNRMQLGIESSIGIEYNLASNLIAFFSFGHQQIFTNYSKVNSSLFPKRSKGLNFELGVLLPISTKK